MKLEDISEEVSVDWIDNNFFKETDLHSDMELYSNTEIYLVARLQSNGNKYEVINKYYRN